MDNSKSMWITFLLKQLKKYLKKSYPHFSPSYPHSYPQKNGSYPHLERSYPHYPHLLVANNAFFRVIHIFDTQNVDNYVNFQEKCG